MMHKDQTHMKRNCFSIGIISSKLQSGCYTYRAQEGTRSLLTLSSATLGSLKVA
jgi:hypothetical protein